MDAPCPQHSDKYLVFDSAAKGRISLLRKLSQGFSKLCASCTAVVESPISESYLFPSLLWTIQCDAHSSPQSTAQVPTYYT